MAASFGLAEMIKLLLEHGANVNARNQFVCIIQSINHSTNMSLTEHEKQIITNTWSLATKDIKQAGLAIFKQ